MLTSLLRIASSWIAPAIQVNESIPLCVPEWSDAMAENHAAIWRKVKPYTAASVERVVALCQSVAYLERHRIPGAVVECGVGKGASMMAAAISLLTFESTQRQLHLYDAVAEALLDGDLDGQPARKLTLQSATEADMLRAQRSLNKVKHAMMLTRYPWEKICFVPGRVEATIPKHAPEQIALLCLDADRHESTYHELEHLYPRLADGGILIVDEYDIGKGRSEPWTLTFANKASTRTCARSMIEGIC